MYLCSANYIGDPSRFWEQCSKCYSLIPGLFLSFLTTIPTENATMVTPQLVQITLSDEERATKKLSSHNLQAALEGLHRDGVCVITNGVDPAHLDKLNERMVPEAKTLYANPQTHRNFGSRTGNIQQEPVVDPNYMFEDVIANPWATAITECMLGPNPHLRFYSANTAFKAEDRQPVHVDVHFDFPKIPFGLCINVNLVATSPENGATELWPGSHRDADPRDSDDTGVIPEIVEARRKISPPVQPSLPKGAIIIRDFRLWHAGMPNRTDDPRVMLVTIHFPAWYRSDLKVILPRSLQGKVDWGHLIPCVEWVDEDYDYLKGRHDHDFTLQP
ncbi:phytanoyl-CoA dioxygenase family protein [Aspergillus piperis CBS 112811]|uniref:Phytanoyl-CoA dioxygenase family protein n=1 Tax=Aspergillus piperis CBS 112811 TaxID=1448313 RepID=A0A8G1VR44_9EURO|nr:phytanoyl-CoA dioxygenase family protein [Aspergillus piperis CBS 112811]RAH61447.1 phytanoyl-CoA dioxygenase family protein [Aspergillus piperis CBS 112811]